MPTYKVTDPTTQKTVVLTGDSPPSEQELNDIFSVVHGGGTTSLPMMSSHGDKPEPGIISRIGKDWADRFQKTKDMVDRNAPTVAEGVWRSPKIAALAAGQLAGGANDIAGEALKSGYNALMPETAKNALAKAVEYVGGSAPIQGATKAISTASREYPDAAMAAEGAINIPVAAMGMKDSATIAANAGRRLIPEDMAANIYKSGAKFSTTMPQATRDAAVKTLLEEKIPLSGKGYDALTEKISSLNQAIKEAIGPSGATRIDPVRANEWVSDAISKANSSFAKGENLAKIQDVVDNFIADHADLTVEKAQKIKQDIYKKLKNNYSAYQRTGQTLYSDGEVAAMKNIARGLKDEVAAAAPEVQALNAKESDLLTAEPMLRRAVNRIGNHNILSLDDVLATGVGASLGGKAGATIMGGLKSLAGSPAMKSNIAIAINSLKQGGNMPISLQLLGKVGDKIRDTFKRDIPESEATAIVNDISPRVNIDQPAYRRSGKVLDLSEREPWAPPEGPAAKSADVFDEMFRIAQSPEGKRLLVERLARDEKHSKILDEILNIPTTKALPLNRDFTMRAPEDVYSPFSPELAQRVKVKSLPPGQGFTMRAPEEYLNALAKAENDRKVMNQLGVKNIPSIEKGGITDAERRRINALRRGLSKSNR